MSALSEKVLILGIDGMDPLQTKKYLDMGLMPNLEKFLEKGAARYDYHMTGGHPTVTPPMWTTLGTGCHPTVHGITDFFLATEDLGRIVYSMDSRKCKAEHIWDVAIEAGKKTLLWHWVGASWPPTSDSPLLHVVDGTQPTGVNIGIAEVDAERVIVATEEIKSVTYKEKNATDLRTMCVNTNMEVEDADEGDGRQLTDVHGEEITTIAYQMVQTSHHTMPVTPLDTVYSPIKAATGWAVEPAEGTKELTILLSGGLISRPCQILKNADGIYDTVVMYKNKKEAEPIAVLPKDVFVKDVIDDAIKGEKTINTTNRSIRVLELAEDGSKVNIWMSAAMDYSRDDLFQPRALYQELVENVGYPQPYVQAFGFEAQFMTDCMLPGWDEMVEYNANSIRYLIDKYDYSLILSHFHNVDMVAHYMVADLKGTDNISNEVCQPMYQALYEQTDRYIGKFLDLLDKGWSILIVSDHGLVCPEYEQSHMYNGEFANNVLYFKDWGYTVLKTDAEGNEIPEIDWTRTVAVTNRINHIYVNLKGRNFHKEPDGKIIEGIVDPKDKWELEERIITDMHSYKNAVTGKREVALALRNKDAELLGLGGPDSGDIVYFLADGYNGDHADGLSTCIGLCDTTLASVFMAAGQGIKHNVKFDRMVRHVDVVPTACMLLDIRMPHECEGAPVYQALDGNFA